MTDHRLTQTSVIFLLMIRHTPRSTLLPYTTLFRSIEADEQRDGGGPRQGFRIEPAGNLRPPEVQAADVTHNGAAHHRSEEHTSESSHLVISYAVFCLKKKNKQSLRSRAAVTDRRCR